MKQTLVLILGCVAVVLAGEIRVAAQKEDVKAVALELKGGKAQVEAELKKDDLKDAVKKSPSKVYSVRFEAGKSYRIDLVSKAFDAFLRLEDPTGKQVAEDDDGGGDRNARIRFSCSSSGSYRIVATSYAGLGAFTLLVEEQVPAKVAGLELKDGKGQVTAALTIDDAKDPVRNSHCKVYSVRLEAGVTYRIDMMSKAFDSFLRLEDSASKKLAEDDDGGGGLNARITFRCPTTGSYRIIATTISGVGAFTLAVEPLVPGKVAVLEVKDGKGRVTAILSPDDPKDTARNTPCKVYPVRLEAGVTYRIDMVSKDFDSYLRLEDATNKELAKDDDSGGGLNARITFPCPATGTYRIIATTYKGGGEFTLSVEGFKSAKPIVLALKDGKGQVEGRLTEDDGKDPIKGSICKIYEVRFEPRRSYRIDLMSKDFDAYLRLEDESGKQLATDDDGGLGSNARITFPCRLPGTYRIVATTLGKLGAFTLAVEETGGARPTPLVLREGKARVEGTLTKDDARDHIDPRAPSKFYDVRFEAGKRYRIDLMSKAFDAYLRLEDAAGKELAKDDDSGGGQNARIVFSPPATGNYRIIATTLATFGPFTLTIEDLAPRAPTVLKFEARVEGTLTDEDPKDKAPPGGPHRSYSVQFESGRIYRIDLMSKDFDAFLRLEDPSGKEIARDDDSGGGLNARIMYLCRTSGTFRVIATTRARVGAFTLTVDQQPAAKPIPLALKDGTGRVTGALTEEDPGDPGAKTGHCKTYTVQLEAGQVYRIDMTSKDLDSYLRLEDSAGNELRKDDDGGGELNAQMLFLCRRSGTYYVVATAIGRREREKAPSKEVSPRSATGSFILAIERPEAVRPVVVNFKDADTKIEGQLTKDSMRDPSTTVAKGFIAGPRPVRVYAVRLEAGKAYRIDMSSQQFDSYLRLEDDEGTVVAQDDDGGGGMNARITFRSTRSGTYYLFATTYALPVKLGAFTLSARHQE